MISYTKKLYIGTGSENVQIGGDGAGSWGSIGGDIDDQADLQEALFGKVPTTRTINNKALTAKTIVGAIGDYVRVVLADDGSNVAKIVKKVGVVRK